MQNNDSTNKEVRKPINTFHINRKYLKAVLRIAAKDDIRYFLNAVYVEVDKKSTTLVTTDGRSLLMIRKEVENTWKGKLLIPPAVAKRLTTGRLSNKLVHNIEMTATRGSLFFADDLSLRDVRISFKSEEGVGNYPDFRKVVPTGASGDAGAINPQFLYQMNMAAKDAGGFGFNGNYINLHQNGVDGCAVCTTDSIDGFLGLIMPYRADAKEYVKPEWAK